MNSIPLSFQIYCYHYMNRKISLFLHFKTASIFLHVHSFCLQFRFWLNVTLSSQHSLTVLVYALHTIYHTRWYHQHTNKSTLNGCWEKYFDCSYILHWTNAMRDWRKYKKSVQIAFYDLKNPCQTVANLRLECKSILFVSVGHIF